MISTIFITLQKKCLLQLLCIHCYITIKNNYAVDYKVLVANSSSAPRFKQRYETVLFNINLYYFSCLLFGFATICRVYTYKVVDLFNLLSYTK